MGATTVRLADDLHERLNARAREEGRSLNDLVVAVLEQEDRRYRRAQTIDRIIALGKRLREKYGVMPGNSVEDIRQIREERTARG